MKAAHAIKGRENNNQLVILAMERERQLRVTIGSRGEDEGRRILGFMGRGRGDMGEGGDGALPDEVEDRKQK